MSIENLRNALPSYAKDMNLNLSSLPRITSLTEQQLWAQSWPPQRQPRLIPLSLRSQQRRKST